MESIPYHVGWIPPQVGGRKASTHLAVVFQAAEFARRQYP